VAPTRHYDSLTSVAEHSYISTLRDFGIPTGRCSPRLAADGRRGLRNGCAFGLDTVDSRGAC
jgi:hypothetical protein